MIHLEIHWPFISVLTIASAALACGSDGGSDGTPSGNTGNTPGDTTGNSPGNTTGSTPGDSTAANGTCGGDPLFEPRSYGEDGTDLIRRMALDSQTGDLFFSAWQEVYRLPAGSSTPELVMARPDEAQPVSGAFWLVGDSLLMPASAGVNSIITAAVPGAEMNLVPVLYQAPRTGGAVTLQVSSLMPSEELVFYWVAGARIVGDEVFWVDVRNERESFSTAAPLDQTYRAWRTSWRTPAAEPEQLLSSDFELEVPVVVNGIAYIEQAISDEPQDGSRQRMIHLADGSIDPSSAEELYGGKVIAGDDQSLIIYDEDIDLEAIDYGLFRVALDGSQKERLYEGFTSLDWRSSAGIWAYDVYVVDTQVRDIYAYQPGSAPRRLGCVPDRATTVHDVVVGPDAVYAAVFDLAIGATILRFPL